MTDTALFRDASGAPGLGVAVTGTNTYRSAEFGGGDCVNWSTHLDWTGNPNGTLTLWASNRPDRNTDGTSDFGWVQVTLPTGMAGPAGSASANFCDIGNSGGRAYRLKYVNASGSGTLLGHAHGKQSS